MRLLHVLTFALTLAAFSPRVGFADESKETAEFRATFTQWKELLGKLRGLQAKYQTAEPSEKSKIEEEFNGLLAEGRKMEPKLVATAEKAYTAEPGENKDVAEFLAGGLLDLVKFDKYEDAARIAHLLLDNKADDPRIAAAAASAFYATNDFAGAEQMFKKAQAAGELDPNKMGQQASLAEYRKFWKQEQAIRDAEAKADDLPRVKLSTSKGDIVIELFENESPIATANFISLVEKGFYNGLKFHRVIPGFMAQGGDPQGTGGGGPGYNIKDESSQENHRNHFRGSLSMAHKQDPDTGGSQFFLNFVPTPHLNGKHTAFGRVIEGLDVLAKIERTEGNAGVTPDKIVKAEVLRKRDHKYTFEKLPDR